MVKVVSDSQNCVKGAASQYRIVASWRSMIPDAPRCRHGSQTDRGLMGGSIHEPDNALASGAVLPKNVRFAVPVEVARTSNAPRCRHGSQTDRGLKRAAIHEQDNALASGVVLPKNVRIAVVVEVMATLYQVPIGEGILLRRAVDGVPPIDP